MGKLSKSHFFNKEEEPFLLLLFFFLFLFICFFSFLLSVLFLPSSLNWSREFSKDFRFLGAFLGGKEKNSGL